MPGSLISSAALRLSRCQLQCKTLQDISIQLEPNFGLWWPSFQNSVQQLPCWRHAFRNLGPTERQVGDLCIVYLLPAQATATTGIDSQQPGPGQRHRTSSRGSSRPSQLR